MDKTRIIVVEDNIVYCEFVCNLLAREGFRTVQAYHLSTAKKLLQQASDGDIVVSDLRLPDGDGIDLLRWMRKEGMTQPLIIMTNYAEVHTAVESMKLGSLDYIPKQLVEDKLMPLLHTILKERSIGHSERTARARSISPTICMIRAKGQGNRLCLWTAVHSPKTLRPRHSSDMSKARLRVRTAQRKDTSMRQRVAHCSWMR